ncbi:MAG: dTDP-4-dehydrorhamnose reductase [Pseudoflavonifractor sp.]|nr:dTDP-4-dehydrorhamnose reductase [Alloprevotella sp.]MCM1117217.1 dTDP-4-dehydrorhamnose reductase [Pseudoflavonifractor sp.]
MKILLTGADGQLGRELSSLLESSMPGVTDYTDIDTLDLTDAEAVARYLAAGEYTHIINCAAYTAVDRAEQEPALCLRVNTDAVTNIAKAAYETGAKVIHISTDYVFDGTSHLPYRESDKVNPTSIYGSSKRKGEMVLLSLCPNAIIIRTAWLYSPYGHNFVKTILSLAEKRKKLAIVSDQIGTPTAASDLAEAILAILRAPQWIPGIFHFTDEGVASWYDFAKAILRMASIRDVTVKPVSTEDYNTENATAASRPPYGVLDKQLIKKTYSLTIPHWEESLAATLPRIIAQMK